MHRVGRRRAGLLDGRRCRAAVPRTPLCRSPYYLRQRFAQVTNPPIDSLREGFVFDMRAWVGSGDTNGDVPAPGSIVMLETCDPRRARVRRRCASTHRLRPAARSRSTLAEGTSLERRLLADLRGSRERRARRHHVHRRSTTAAPAPRARDARGRRDPSALDQRGAAHAGVDRRRRRVRARRALDRDRHRGRRQRRHAVARAARRPTAPARARRSSRPVRVGPAQDHGQARHLHAALVHRRADVRVGRARTRRRASCASRGCGARAGASASRSSKKTCARGAQPRASGEAPPDRGLFRFRRDGIRHAFDPALLKTLRAAAMTGDYAAFVELSDAMEARAADRAARSDRTAHPLGMPIPLDEVEPADAIVRRFVTAAMSLGALAPEVHETIARRGQHDRRAQQLRRRRRGAAALPARAGSGRSAIKQVASARFGVGVYYLGERRRDRDQDGAGLQARRRRPDSRLQGHRPRSRRCAARSPGQALISPPPHHDIYSIEDLAELIYDLRRAAPHARIAVKLGQPSRASATSPAASPRRAPTSSTSAATTAAPAPRRSRRSSTPACRGNSAWSKTHHTLVANGLRSRVKLRVDGGFKTGRDVIARRRCSAPTMFGFGSALLVALGCIYARQCHKNTCPGRDRDAKIRSCARNSRARRKKRATFFEFVADDVRRRLAALGARSPRRDSRPLRSAARAGCSTSSIAHVDLSGDPAAARSGRRPRDDAVADEPHVDDVVRPDETVAAAAGRSRRRRADRARHRRARANAANGIEPERVALHRARAGQSFGAFHHPRPAARTRRRRQRLRRQEHGRRHDRRARARARADEAVDRQRVLLRRARRRGVRQRRAGERLAVRNSGARDRRRRRGRLTPAST